MSVRERDWRGSLDGDASSERLLAALGEAGVRDPHAGRERLMRMGVDAQGRTALAECLPALLVTLSDAANPDQALVSFERFAQAVSDRVAFFGHLRANPRAIEILARIFAGSQFLTEILLCNAESLDRLTQQKRMADLKSVQQLHIEAQGAMLGISDPEAQLNALRRFQRWEILRIGICDFFGLLDLRRVTVQLSLLADALVQTCLGLAYEQAEIPPRGMAVLALGKLGGEELNYSSDIDLMFIARQSSAPQWRVGQRLIRMLTTMAADGFLYRVDMRLRPWGRSGELVTAVESHGAYLREQAQPWEKQALLKARVIAGDREVGRDFLRMVEPLIYALSPDVVRHSVQGMKQRIEDDLRKRGKIWGEVKLGQGSIRDIEFVTQYLQLLHGGENPAVRSFNTLDALVRLTDSGWLQADEFRTLTDGYVFLRTVEHALQLVHNKQTHELPQDRRELGFLARRLDFVDDDQFLTHYDRHVAAVRMVYERFLGGPPAATPPPPSATPRAGALHDHLSRMEQSYSVAFSERDIERHASLAGQISERQVVVVEAEPQADGLWRVTIVGFDYLGELSLICGLLLVYGCDIVEGQVFTYEPVTASDRKSSAEQGPGSRRKPRRATGPAREVKSGKAKIVDVFTVRGSRASVTPEIWSHYEQELAALLRKLQRGKIAEVHGGLAKRVAAALKEEPADVATTLYPVEIEIDNSLSEHHTVLRIRARDTVGFLYELTNALALNEIYIARVRVQTRDAFVADTLHVTDAAGRKITDLARQRELQAATVLIKHFTHLLPHAPNPEAALLHFREFVSQLFTRLDWPDTIASLERTEVLDALARLLGVSDFLWSDFLRIQHANLFPVVRDVHSLTTAKSAAQLTEELDAALAAAQDPEQRRIALNEFKDREMFRIDMRHIMGRLDSYVQFSDELSNVAEVVVRAAYQMSRAEVLEEFGAPRARRAPARIAVCALGKCGGRELGFASDIELLFIYSGEGQTQGPAVISNGEFFVHLIERFTQTIRARHEGIFQIDLRLRPYGRAGSLAVSLQSFRDYFGPEGAAWPFERQALVKLRPIAGDADLGREIVRLRDGLIYTGESFDVVAMRGMRERQLRQLVIPGTWNAKLSPGALVDVEYVIQGLQITHGHQYADLREPNTLLALDALERRDLAPSDDAQRLRDAYLFHRQLITALRIVRGNAKDLTLPARDSEEFAFLCRRLNYSSVAELEDGLRRHAQFVQDIVQRWLG